MYGGLHFINGPNGEKNYNDMKEALGHPAAPGSWMQTQKGNGARIRQTHMYNSRAFIVKCYQQSDYTKWQQRGPVEENSSTNANGKAGADERMSISNTGKQYKWRHLEKKTDVLD
jgi:hypothetical protein